MYRIYLYPKNNYKSEDSRNPYVSNLEVSLSKCNRIVNLNYTKRGILDFFKYIFSTDVYLFNWIEDLPSKRYGKLQTIFFIVFLICAKILSKKIVWILHNKYSHNKFKNKWTDFMYETMIKRSDLVLTHSISGIDFIKEKYPLYVAKIKYVIHPIQEIFPSLPEKDKLYDFLIWGIIYPYKGILEFLNFITESKNIPVFRILIVGRCLDQKLKKELNKYLSTNIIHYDQFFSIEEISKFANQSKFILFTYKSVSVLSSGALIDSIRMGSVIIGPNVGSFKDLNSFSFVKTYDNYEEIINIYNDYRPFNGSTLGEINRFYFENNWGGFGEKFFKELKNVVQLRKKTLYKM